MVRRVATELKIGFIVAVRVASLATFRSSMAIFKAGITLPWPCCCLGSFIMVEMQGSHGEATRCGGCEEEPNPYAAVWVSIDRLLEGTAPNRGLPLERIGARPARPTTRDRSATASKFPGVLIT